MRSCLVVIDFQNDFVGGSLGTKEAVAIEERIAGKIRERRAEGFDILFTLDTHAEDYLATQEGKKLPVVHCVKGTDGHALCRAVEKARRPEDRVFEKPTFGSAELFDWFRENPYDEIELVGVCTDICVVANAVLVKTACPEAEVEADAACMAGVTPEKHNAALEVLRSLQVTVENA